MQFSGFQFPKVYVLNIWKFCCVNIGYQKQKIKKKLMLFLFIVFFFSQLNQSKERISLFLPVQLSLAMAAILCMPPVLTLDLHIQFMMILWSSI